MEKAREFVLKIFRLLMKPEMRILPGQLAFFIVITIIPLVALIATITAALSISTETIRYVINESFPTEVAGIINGIITGDGINFNIIIFYFSAFLLASNGCYSMINTSNEIYKVKPRKFIPRRLKAISMTFILVFLFLFLVLVPVFGTNIFDILVGILGEGRITILLKKILSIIKYPIVITIIYLNIKLMYVIAPDKEIPSKSTTKGAMFTTVGWVLATEVFAFYIEKFARYDIFYGSISNILILLLWVYLLSYIFVLGMVINASDYKGELE